MYVYIYYVSVVSLCCYCFRDIATPSSAQFRIKRGVSLIIVSYKREIAQYTRFTIIRPEGVKEFISHGDVFSPLLARNGRRHSTLLYAHNK